MKVIIVGGGITGLSAAWFCKRKYPNVQITLLEKENRLGGAIRTSHEGGFLFEKGPRTFQLGRSPHLLPLISDLHLEILTSPPQKRYIYTQGKLRTLGSFIPWLIPYLIRELFIAPSNLPDESIYDFASRRFSPKIADTLFDPLTLGIYGGDIRKLSLRTCFPSFYYWEREKGSVVRGMLSASKTAKGLFTIKGGMETLIFALQKQMDLKIVLNCSVEKIDQNGVFAMGKTWSADKVISALPPPFPAKSLWIVSLAYKRDVLPKKGFGYLVPSKEKQSLLGVVFDSVIFPEQGESRLTAMIRSEEAEPLQAALRALQLHLEITEEPIYTSVFYAKNAIAQFEVGCNYKEGISVDASVHRGEKLALDL